jgi:hypothetical protein
MNFLLENANLYLDLYKKIASNSASGGHFNFVLLLVSNTMVIHFLGRGGGVSANLQLLTFVMIFE